MLFQAKMLKQGVNIVEQEVGPYIFGNLDWLGYKSVADEYML